MKNKNLIVGLTIAVAFVAAVILISRPFASKGAAKPALGKGRIEGPVKKALSNNMGGLTVKLLNAKEREMLVRVKAFKSDGAKVSTYAASFMSNRMQELAPGNYDIEVETAPQKIYKDIKISAGKEVVKDLGSSGIVNVKALNAKKNKAYYGMRILYPRSNIVVSSGTTNKPIEMLPGLYDIEIQTFPGKAKTGVKVEVNRETTVDLGCVSGTLLVKALTEDRKEARCLVKVKNSENDVLITSVTTNRPVEMLQGVYNIEVVSNPSQAKKGVKVTGGEETSVEFTVPTPAVQAPARQAAGK